MTPPVSGSASWSGRRPRRSSSRTSSSRRRPSPGPTRCSSSSGGGLALRAAARHLGPSLRRLAPHGRGRRQRPLRRRLRRRPAGVGRDAPPARQSGLGRGARHPGARRGRGRRLRPTLRRAAGSASSSLASGFGALDFLLNSLLVRTSPRRTGPPAERGQRRLRHRLGPRAGAGHRRAGRPTTPCSSRGGRRRRAIAHRSPRGVSAPPCTPRHRGPTPAPSRRSSASSSPPTSSTSRPRPPLPGWIAPQLHRVGHSQRSAPPPPRASGSAWPSAGSSPAGPSPRQRPAAGAGRPALSAALCRWRASTSLAPLRLPPRRALIGARLPDGTDLVHRRSSSATPRTGVIILTMMAGGVIGPALTGLAVSLRRPGCPGVASWPSPAADFFVFLVWRVASAVNLGGRPGRESVRLDAADRWATWPPTAEVGRLTPV